jgi:cytochrome c peroxidase
LDSRAKTLENQAQGSIESEIEMNVLLNTVIARLKQVPQYQHWFKRVFGSMEFRVLIYAKQLQLMKELLSLVLRHLIHG